MIRVGIVAPMWGEAQCFTPPNVPRRRLSEIGEGVHLCVSGMGRERAALAARELLAQGASALVSAGVAGGLDPRLSAGDLVIADRVIAAPGGLVTADRARAEARLLPTDAAWRDALSCRLRENHLECVIDAIVESPGVLASPEQKTACYRDTGAVAVDMESAAIADEAARAGVPCLVLRAVCDPAGLCIPRCALAAADPQGKPRPAQFLAMLLRHPSEIADVVRLQRAFRKAQHALRTAVRLAGTRLCAAE